MSLFRNGLFVVLSTVVALGCSGDADVEEFHEHQHELAIAGPWVPPSNIVSLADSYAIGYTGAGPWVGSSGCSGNFTSGAQVLKDWVLANWPQVTAVGGYSCRPIVGNSSSMSVHGTGRAIDIHIPLDGSAADNGLGDPLANYLIEHADELGIQMVIWDRWMWSPSRTPRSRSYGGQHAHHDHLHVEITPQAARQELPWYQGGATAPQASNCETVSAQGRVIDDTDSCFVAFGPSSYWRRVSDGMGGSLLWTNAYQSSSPSNWARWNIDIDDPGVYLVEYYRTDGYAVFDSTNYRVRAGGVETDVYLDQSAGSDGWEEIGTYSFAAGDNQWVAIFDNSPGGVADNQRIVVDAIRIRPVGSPPPPPPPGSDDDDPPSNDPPGTTGDDDTPSGDNGPGGTSDAPTGSLVDVDGADPEDYGTHTDDALPPKGSYDPEIDESYHEEPELVFEDREPESVHLQGHSCSTGTGPATGLWWVGFALIGLRRRARRDGSRQGQGVTSSTSRAPGKSSSPM